MEDQEHARLIKKYLEGTCTPEEKERVHQWYDDFPDLPPPLEMEHLESRQHLQNNILARIRSNIAGEVPERQSTNRTKILTYASIAAAICVIVSLLFVRQYTAPIKQQPKLSSTITLITEENKGLALVKKILPDGSIIWLNPGAKITYPKVFSGNERRISMSGEAFFSVTPNKEKPFVINSGSFETRVWGTSFRIRDYPGVKPQVFVATGKVSVKLVSTQNEEVMLIPNEKIELEPKSGKIAKKTAYKLNSDMQIWKKASISFADTPLAEVAHRLKQEFGSDIILSDKVIGTYLLTADFSDQNLADILEMLCKSVNVHYTINGSQILLKNN